MQRALLIIGVVITLAASAQAEDEIMVAAGIGAGELIHAEAGLFLSPRTLIEARAGWLIFNPVVGLGATYAWGGSESEGGRPPRHGWLLRAELMVNPTLGEFRIEERGETIGAYSGVYGGYAFTGDGGFYFRALLGAIIGKENDYIGPMGPNMTLSFGAVL